MGWVRCEWRGTGWWGAAGAAQCFGFGGFMKKQLTVGELVGELLKVDQGKKVDVCLRDENETAVSVCPVVGVKEYGDVV